MTARLMYEHHVPCETPPKLIVCHEGSDLKRDGMSRVALDDRGNAHYLDVMQMHTYQPFRVQLAACSVPHSTHLILHTLHYVLLVTVYQPGGSFSTAGRSVASLSYLHANRTTPLITPLHNLFGHDCLAAVEFKPQR